jgi:multidrug resistance efflux pump
MPIKNNIELRSDEVQEIIGTAPPKIILYGISSVFLIVFFLVVGSFFFKYPDIITSEITVIGENPSAEIKARASGKIMELFVEDSAFIIKGQHLAIIENTCNYNDLQRLKSDLDVFERNFQNLERFFREFTFSSSYSLGENQSAFASFIAETENYRNFLELDYQGKKIKAYQKQINANKKYINNLKKQFLLSQKDLELTKNQLKRDSALFKKEFLSQNDLEKSKSNYILKQRTLENSRSTISNSEIRITELEQLIIESEIQKSDEKRNFEINITELYENLRAQIRKWEQEYLLISPLDGIITFNNFRNETQHVDIGETVFNIVPNEAFGLKGYAEVPLAGSGKIKVGQRVNIKFDDYPDTQFGMVRGTVESISLVQNDDFYTVKVKLPDSLYTNYNMSLVFKQNMSGTAEILTDELPLAARIINPVKSLFYEKF